MSYILKKSKYMKSSYQRVVNSSKVTGLNFQSPVNNSPLIRIVTDLPSRSVPISTELSLIHYKAASEIHSRPIRSLKTCHYQTHANSINHPLKNPLQSTQHRPNLQISSSSCEGLQRYKETRMLYARKRSARLATTRTRQQSPSKIPEESRFFGKLEVAQARRRRRAEIASGHINSPGNRITLVIA